MNVQMNYALVKIRSCLKQGRRGQTGPKVTLFYFLPNYLIKFFKVFKSFFFFFFFLNQRMMFTQNSCILFFVGCFELSIQAGRE